MDFDIHKIIMMINKNDENSEAVVVLDNETYNVSGTKALAVFELMEDLVNIIKDKEVDKDGKEN